MQWFRVQGELLLRIECGGHVETVLPSWPCWSRLLPGSRSGDDHRIGEGKNNEKSNENRLFRRGIDGNRTRGFARVCAAWRGSETRIRARNPEHPRKEHGCRRGELRSRRQIASPSPCPVGIHLRLRAVRCHS